MGHVESESAASALDRNGDLVERRPRTPRLEVEELKFKEWDCASEKHDYYGEALSRGRTWDESERTCSIRSTALTVRPVIHLIIKVV